MYIEDYRKWNKKGRSIHNEQKDKRLYIIGVEITYTKNGHNRYDKFLQHYNICI